MIRYFNLKVIVLILVVMDFIVNHHYVFARMVRKDDFTTRETRASVQIVEYLLNFITLTPEDFSSAPSNMNIVFNFVENVVLTKLDILGEVMKEYYKQYAERHDRTIAEYAEWLREKGPEYFKEQFGEDLVGDLKTSIITPYGDSSLFRFILITGRENKPHDFIYELIEEKVGKGDFTMRMKSIGCGDGKEAYGLAILVYSQLNKYAQEHDLDFNEWIKRWDILIEAYEISMLGLFHAKKGVYPSESLLPEGTSIELFVPGSNFSDFFIQDSPGWSRVIEQLRAWVSFQYIDLYNDYQVERLKDNRHELVVFRNPDPLSKERRRVIRELIRGAFNPDYEGLFIWNDPEPGYMSLESTYEEI